MNAALVPAPSVAPTEQSTYTRRPVQKSEYEERLEQVKAEKLVSILMRLNNYVVQYVINTSII